MHRGIHHGDGLCSDSVSAANGTEAADKSDAREQWQPEASAREWRYLVIHHTASSAGSVESIHEAHLGRGWQGIGYHFLIGNGNGMGDGEIEPTFRWREQLHGAHAGKDEYNQHGIGICLVGNFQDSHPSAAQLTAVKQLVATLKAEYGLASSQVIAHKDVKATACPGKNFPLADISRSDLASGVMSVSHVTRHQGNRSMQVVPASATGQGGSPVVPADWRSSK